MLQKLQTAELVLCTGTIYTPGMDLISHIFFVDCQSSGASPQNSELLELGWNRHAWILKPQNEVPRRILKLVGLTDDEIQSGVSVTDIWQTLQHEISQKQDAFAVAHFARFERIYLDRLWQQVCGTNFPFTLLCTHALAKRLFPNLPCYGLRALAGWFGNPLPEGKRVSEQIAATECIWTHVKAELLKRGIHTVEEAHAFCQTRPEKPKTKQKLSLIPKERRLSLPKTPGIYQFLDHQGRILYVGKATSLRQRINSYFTGGCRGDHRKLEMLAQAADIKVVPAPSPLAAALLEFEEIQRLSPRYNIALKAAPRRYDIALEMLATPWQELSRQPALLRLASKEIFYGLTSEQLDVLQAGLVIWRSSIQVKQDQLLTRRELLAYGVKPLKAWIAEERARRLAQAEVAESLDDSNSEDDLERELETNDKKESDFVWTPELIAAECTRILRRSTRYYLQKKWWDRLSRATIFYRWAMRDKASQALQEPHMIRPGDVQFDSEEPRRIQILLQELRRLETRGGTWQIVEPRPMTPPFWV